MALTTQQQILQNQIDALDSSATTESLLKILNQSIAAGTIMWGYDSASVMPADSDYIGMIAFSNTDSNLYFHGTDLNWHLIDSAASVPAPTPSFVFQGSSYGYASGGGNPTGNNTVDKYPFASDGSATDVGDLTDGRRYGAGHSSSTHAYTAGGGYSPPAANFKNIIDRYPFSTDENATDVGDLFVATQIAAAATSSTDGYLAGGGTTPSPASTNIIQKYPLAASSSSTDTADLTRTVTGAAGATSSTDGYAMGGADGGTVTNVVDKFPLSSDANSTDVGDTTVSRQLGAGGSSTTYGYLAGGYIGPTWSNVIDKFPFASDGNLTDVGNLYQSKGWVSGVSSTTSGYANGGIRGPITTYTTNLDKYSFASDGNGSDVGDLTLSRFAAAGHQV